MDEQNHPYPGEEHHYSQTGKIRVPSSQLQSQRLIRIFIGIITILLVILIVFGFLIVHLLTSQNSLQPVVLVTPTTVATPSHTATTPIPTPTTTPALTPTPLPPGTVLCESGGTNGWKNWQLFGPWKLLPNDNSILLSDGSETSPLVAPQKCQPKSADYAVEVILKTIHVQGDFGVNVYARRVPNGGYGARIYPFSSNGASAFIFAIGAGDLNGTNIGDVNVYNMHNYRLEVKSNTISFFIDEQKYASTIDNRYFSPGEVSFSVAGQAEGKNFKVSIL